MQGDQKAGGYFKFMSLEGGIFVALKVWTLGPMSSPQVAQYDPVLAWAEWPEIWNLVDKQGPSGFENMCPAHRL